MKVGLPGGVIVILLVAFLAGVPSAWSQDAAQPAMSQEEKQPDAQDMAQPGMAEEKPQTAPQEMDQPAVRLAEAAVCQDVVDRTPVGSGDVFAKEVPKVYCFTHVVGAEPGTEITHNWYYNGNLKASVKLPVRSPDYRTWSSKTMIPEWSGEWMVEILSADGKPLESIIFFLK